MFKALLRVITLVSVIGAGGWAYAAELVVMDLPLHTATREQAHSAITRSGGKLISSVSDLDKYEVRDIGMPFATEMEAVYLEDQLVMLQYEFVPRGRAGEEQLRRVSGQRYGEPIERGDFRGQYIRDGKYAWTVEHSMQLVFSKAFAAREVYLTYVNLTLTKSLEARVAKAEEERLKQVSEAASSLF